MEEYVIPKPFCPQCSSTDVATNALWPLCKECAISALKKLGVPAMVDPRNTPVSELVSLVEDWEDKTGKVFEWVFCSCERVSWWAEGLRQHRQFVQTDTLDVATMKDELILVLHPDKESYPDSWRNRSDIVVCFITDPRKLVSAEDL